MAQFFCDLVAIIKDVITVSLFNAKIARDSLNAMDNIFKLKREIWNAGFFC